jgi:hypothetical protein
MPKGNKMKARTKSEVFAALAQLANVPRKQVAVMFEGLAGIMKKDLRGPGIFVLPGLLKVTVAKKPAVKAHERPDPFHPGEMMRVKAKPARKVVKVRPLKSLKAMVS